jgi:cell division protease FtsH
MSDKIGPITLVKKQTQVFLGRDISQHDQISESTANLIDSEVKRMITEAHNKCRDILTAKRDLLEVLAEELLVKETLEAEQIFELSLPHISGKDREIVENQFKKIKAINQEIEEAKKQAKKEEAKKKRAEAKKKREAEKAKMEAEAAKSNESLDLNKKKNDSEDKSAKATEKK